MIIDAHTHFGETAGKILAAEDLLSGMDEAGINYSMVIADSTSPKTSSIEKIVEAARKNPRLKPVGDVDFADFSYKQIQKLFSYLDRGDLYGIKFYLGYEEYYANSRLLYPLYEYLQDHNKPAIFHTGALETEALGLLKYSHPLTIDEVANQFPKLKIVMAHMGNPWLIDCAAVLAKNKNVYADMSGFFAENYPIETEDIKVFVAQLSQMNTFLGSFDKFLFGTDWPLYSQKEYLDAVLSLPMSAREKELVLWKNANKLFNLKV